MNVYKSAQTGPQPGKGAAAQAMHPSELGRAVQAAHEHMVDQCTKAHETAQEIFGARLAAEGRNELNSNTHEKNES
jgi:hypothetical protein